MRVLSGRGLGVKLSSVKWDDLACTMNQGSIYIQSEFIEFKGQTWHLEAF